MSEQEQPGPPWSEAPEWAKWKAMDGDDLWYWFSLEPTWDILEWRWLCQGEKGSIIGRPSLDHASKDCRGIYGSNASGEKYQRPS